MEIFGSLIPMTVLMIVIVNQNQCRSIKNETNRSKRDGTDHCAVALASMKGKYATKAEVLANYTTSLQVRDLMVCQAFNDEHCYNGWYNLRGAMGYTREEMKEVCKMYRKAWQPCCFNTPQEDWDAGVLKHCPMYMGSCIEFEQEFQEMESNGIEIVAPTTYPAGDPSKQTYAKDCPFMALCDGVEHPSFFPVCATFASLRNLDCSQFSEPERAYLKHGCKKYKRRCM